MRRRRRRVRATTRPFGPPSTGSPISLPMAGGVSASGPGTPRPSRRSAPWPTPSSPAAASGPATSAPTRRYDDQTAINATNLQVDAFVTDLRDRHVVEDLLADPLAGPGKQARAMVTGYAAGIERWKKTHRVTDPACRGAAYLKEVRDPPRHLVRHLHRQPERLGRSVHPGHRDRGAAGARGEGAVGSDEPPVRRPGEAAQGARSRPGPRLRVQRDRGGRPRHHDRQGHAAGQPALPVGRPLPVHPAAAHHPREVRRRGCVADRVAGGEHRLEQERRVEPHGLDRLPVHAVPVHLARRALLRHRPRSAGAHARRGEHRRTAEGRLDHPGPRGPLPHPPGVRRERAEHPHALVDVELLGHPRRQRRAAAHDRHLLGHGQGA